MAQQNIKVTELKHSNEPYGTEIITGTWTPYTQQDVDNAGIDRSMIKARLARQGGILKGTIIKGTRTSRLFHHTKTEDISGTPVNLYVTKREIEKNFKRSIAM